MNVHDMRQRILAKKLAFESLVPGDGQIIVVYRVEGSIHDKSLSYMYCTDVGSKDVEGVSYAAVDNKQPDVPLDKQDLSIYNLRSSYCGFGSGFCGHSVEFKALRLVKSIDGFRKHRYKYKLSPAEFEIDSEMDNARTVIIKS